MSPPKTFHSFLVVAVSLSVLPLLCAGLASALMYLYVFLAADQARESHDDYNIAKMMASRASRSQ